MNHFDNPGKYEVLGVGTPLLDHLLQISDQYLDSIPGKKYGMELVEYPEMVSIIEKSGTTPRQIAGGSCANAIKGLASLGKKCAITGKIGKDAIGEKVLRDLQDIGVLPLVKYSDSPTAHVACLITPDGNRTCRSFLGAGMEMQPEDLVSSHFHGVKLVHIEGYTMLYDSLTERAMQFAKNAGALVSLDLGSFEIVENYRDHVLHLLDNYVDIVFSNEDEAHALTEKSPEESCNFLQSLCHVAVVMMGEKGCWVGKEGAQVFCPVKPLDAIDTTGAGDLFASGFLYGFLEEQPIDVCAKWGSITAGQVVQIIGAEIPRNQWGDIKKSLYATSSGSS